MFEETKHLKIQNFLYSFLSFQITFLNINMNFFIINMVEYKIRYVQIKIEKVYRRIPKMDVDNFDAYSEDKAIFFDGFAKMIYNNRNYLNLDEWTKTIVEKHSILYIHVLCKHSNKISATCKERMWISLSFVEEKKVGIEFITSQNTILLYTGYPYAQNLFAMPYKAYSRLRHILESPEYQKILATHETANDAVNIFFMYFKIKLKGLKFVVKDNNRWLTDLESMNNLKNLKDLIVSMKKEVYSYATNLSVNDFYIFVTKFISKDEISETDNPGNIIALLGTLHKVMHRLYTKDNFIISED
ncbi:hypothetical protein TRFO_35512 [Tritrichomonas foetus]|uniref:Uncharacterized protein n=1 Tax=Tritrichomonas foetus TaxID=1144522 RepID=A0A1J4JG26_9EUKA|nr:hypothetical protein TRFO_35512 [Tritrichomonas foetus]|eukprot:OHS98096.1 hypothetical protein TRFO_35512 [Tritrichomonas foetus]